MKQKGLYLTTLKKAKNQNNVKTTMIDTQRKLNTLIAKVKSLHLEQFSLQDKECAGKTVKDLTDYFENISKYNKRLVNYDSKKKNPITVIPKPNIPCPKKKHLNTANLQTVWRDLMMQRNFYYKGYKENNIMNGANVLNTVRESLRSSFVTCFMMLQYIL